MEFNGGHTQHFLRKHVTPDQLVQISRRKHDFGENLMPSRKMCQRLTPWHFKK